VYTSTRLVHLARGTLVGALAAATLATAEDARADGTAEAIVEEQTQARVLTVGSTAWVSGTNGAGLRVHTTPLLSSQQIAPLNEGSQVQVLQGPVAADGYTWYQVTAPTLAGPGWVVGGALSATR
jgi:hypothetical protein